MSRRVRPPVTAGVVMVAAAWICVGHGPVPTTTVFGEEARGQSRDTRFERLGTVMRQAMADIGVPGVAVASVFVTMDQKKRSSVCTDMRYR